MAEANGYAGDAAQKAMSDGPEVQTEGKPIRKLACGHDWSDWRMRCTKCGHVALTNGSWHGHEGIRSEVGFCSECARCKDPRCKNCSRVTQPTPAIQYGPTVEDIKGYYVQLEGAAPSLRTASQPDNEQLVVDLARELYNRFVMGGWEPQDAYPQIRKMLNGRRLSGEYDPRTSGERWLARRGFADSRNYSSAELGPLLEEFWKEVEAIQARDSAPDPPARTAGKTEEKGQ